MPQKAAVKHDNKVKKIASIHGVIDHHIAEIKTQQDKFKANVLIQLSLDVDEASDELLKNINIAIKEINQLYVNFPPFAEEIKQLSDERKRLEDKQKEEHADSNNPSNKRSEYADINQLHDTADTLNQLKNAQKALGKNLSNFSQILTQFKELNGLFIPNVGDEQHNQDLMNRRFAHFKANELVCLADLIFAIKDYVLRNKQNIKREKDKIEELIKILESIAHTIILQMKKRYEEGFENPSELESSLTQSTLDEGWTPVRKNVVDKTFDSPPLNLPISGDKENLLENGMRKTVVGYFVYFILKYGNAEDKKWATTKGWPTQQSTYYTRLMQKFRSASPSLSFLAPAYGFGMGCASTVASTATHYAGRQWTNVKNVGAAAAAYMPSIPSVPTFTLFSAAPLAKVTEEVKANTDETVVPSTVKDTAVEQHQDDITTNPSEGMPTRNDRSLRNHGIFAAGTLLSDTAQLLNEVDVSNHIGVGVNFASTLEDSIENMSNNNIQSPTELEKEKLLNIKTICDVVLLDIKMLARAQKNKIISPKELKELFILTRKLHQMRNEKKYIPSLEVDLKILLETECSVKGLSTILKKGFCWAQKKFPEDSLKDFYPEALLAPRR